MISRTERLLNRDKILCLQIFPYVTERRQRRFEKKTAVTVSSPQTAVIRRRQLMKKQRMVVGQLRQAACDARLSHTPASVPSHHCVLIPLCICPHTAIPAVALGGHPELLLLAD